MKSLIKLFVITYIVSFGVSLNASDTIVNNRTLNDGNFNMKCNIFHRPRDRKIVLRGEAKNSTKPGSVTINFIGVNQKGENTSISMNLRIKGHNKEMINSTIKTHSWETVKHWKFESITYSKFR